MWGASGHFDFFFSPIDLWIMFLEPGMSKYQFLFAQTSDTEGCSFRMIFVLEDEADSFSNGTGLVRRPIYVYYRLESGRLASAD